MRGTQASCNSGCLDHGDGDHDDDDHHEDDDDDDDDDDGRCVL